MWRRWYGGPKLLCLCTVGSLRHLGATVSLCFFIFEWSKLWHCRVSSLLCFEATIRVQLLHSCHFTTFHSGSYIHLPSALSFLGILVNSCGAIITVNTRLKYWLVALCSWLTSCSASQLSSTSRRWVALAVPKTSFIRGISEQTQQCY